MLMLLSRPVDATPWGFLSHRELGLNSSRGICAIAKFVVASLCIKQLLLDSNATQISSTVCMAVAEPDANHIRRDMRDSVFLNAAMIYNLQRGKLQQHDARTISSKYHSHRVIFSSGRVNAPFCGESSSLVWKTAVICLPYLKPIQKDPCTPGNLFIFFLYILLRWLSQSNILQNPAQHLPYLRKEAFPTQPPLHADHSPAFNIPWN